MASFFKNDFKSELTLGKIAGKVVVTLVVAVLIFSYEKISSIILKIYKTLSQTLYDQLLESVAAGPKDYSLLLAIFIQSLLLTLFATVAYNLIQRMSNNLHKEGAESRPEKTQDPQSRINKIKRLRNFTKWYFAATLMFLLYTLLHSALEISKSEIIQSFDRKVKIISPYTDNKLKEKLVSDFSLMKSEADYNKINSTFDSLFKAFKIHP